MIYFSIGLSHRTLPILTGDFQMASVRRRESGVSKHEDELMVCECGLPSVVRTFRKQTSSLGRQFYGCQNFMDNGCTFFRWAEDPIDINRARVLILELRDENRAIRQQVGNSNVNLILELRDEIAALKAEFDDSQKKIKNATSVGEKEAKKKKCYKFLLMLTWAMWFITWVCSSEGKGEREALGLP